MVPLRTVSLWFSRGNPIARDECLAVLCHAMPYILSTRLPLYQTIGVKYSAPAAGAGRLGRAGAKGPRAYARLALFPRDPGRDPGQGPAALRTPLQPPGFCPDFAAHREFPLLLDAQCVRMLATQVRAQCVHQAPCAEPFS